MVFGCNKIGGFMKKIDLILFVSVIVLSIFGLVMIYSASSIWAEYKFGDAYKFLKAETLFLILGITLMIITSKIPYSYYLKNANLILGICVLLLILVLIPGVGTVRNGSRSWFGIGSFGIQPSEFTKLGLLIFTSKYLSKNNKLIKDIKKGVLPILGVLFLIFGLIMLQPDFGTGTVIVMTIVVLLFISGVKMGFFVKIGFLGIVGVAVLIIIAPYRLQRILSFLDPWSDPLGSGFQIIQSLYAIGPGGLFGTGYLNSRQKNFYLPEPQTDFIFSIIAEEFGIVGALVVLSLFALLLTCCIKITLKQEDKFAKYLCFGLTFQLIVQVIMNLSVVIGLIPVTGVTLPFLSYGGSSLLTSLIGIGIILNISKNN